MSLLSKLNKKKQESIVAYLMIAPALILLIIFVFIPLVMAIYRAFFDTNALGSTYVGFKYYKEIISDPYFLESIKNVLIMALVITVTQIVISFLFANVLVRIKGRYGIFVRTIIYLPYLLSGIVVSIIFWLITDYKSGILNSLIMQAGGEPISWTGFNYSKFLTAILPPLAIIVPTIWIGFGYTTLVMYAGLINIPKDYYEAAQIDGANWWQQTFKISIPCMKNYFVLLTVTSIVSNLQMYEIPLIMTGGGPTNSTMTPVLFIMLNRGKGNYSDSKITAMAIIVMIVILLINSTVFYLFRDRKEKAA